MTILFVGSNSNEESMLWNESRKLTWADFKASPDLKSRASAITASGITFEYSVKTSRKEIVDFSTKVEAHFYPNKSWFLEKQVDVYILAHEQLHFDIIELYARKLREQLSLLVVNQNLKGQMNRLHASINKALNDTQQLYDLQTNHSINVTMQKEWEAKIIKELKTYEAYKS